MSILDLVILIVAAVALITGAMKGFVRQIGTIVGLVAGILACRIFGSDAVSYCVPSESEHHSLLTALVYMLLFVVVFVGIGLIARLLHSVLSALKMGFINRASGALFRLVLWIVFLSLAVNVYLGICPEDTAKFHVQSKPWREITLDAAPKILGYLAN